MCADDLSHEQWLSHSGRFPFFGRLFRSRIARGDMSPIILRVLAKEPMHGYQIIRTLEEKSHGFWRPSAGSVYPTLQLLAEQGLVSGKEIDGKTVYSLTVEGKTAAKKLEDHLPWKEHGKLRNRFHTFAPAIRDLFHELKAISQLEDESTIEKATKILRDTAKDLQQLIA